MKKQIMLWISLLFFGVSWAKDKESLKFNRWTDLTQEVSSELSNNNGVEYALVDNTLHVLWVENKASAPLIGNLYYRRSVDNGDSWEEPKKLHEFDDKTNLPALTSYCRMMAVHENSVHIAYINYDYTNNGTGKLYYVRSTNGGASFEEPIELANTGGGYNKIATSLIKVANKRVAIAYHHMDTNASKRGIRVAYSTDNGANFRDTLVVKRDLYNSDLIDFSYDGQQMIFLHHYLYLYYGFHTGRTYATISNNNGASFITHKLSRTYEDPDLSPGSNTKEKATFAAMYASINHYVPRVASYGNFIHIVFDEFYLNAAGKATQRNAYIRSTDKGLSFEDIISFEERENATPPTVVAKDNRVYIATRKSVNDNLLVIRSVDNGASFLPAEDHFTQRHNQNSIKPNAYKIVIDTNDSTASTIHLIGDRHFLATSHNYGESFDYFMATNADNRTYELMHTDVLFGKNKLKHFFINYMMNGTATSQPYTILYHKTGNEPLPTDKNTALTIKETSGNTTDDSPLLIPDSPTLAFDSLLTIELWVKCNPQNAVNIPLVLRLKEGYWNDETPNGFHLSSVVTALKAIQFRTGIQTDYGKFYMFSPDLIQDTLWHHVAVTYDANGGKDNYILYVDGEAKISQTIAGKIDAGNGIISIGHYGIHRTYAYNHQIDELRLWNKALTQEDLQRNMARNTFEGEEHLKVYLNFNGTLKDLSGNGNDAIEMGMLNLLHSNLSPPLANFDVYKTLNEVWINDKTQNGAVAKWDFGNKASSTQTNPKYQYPKAGEYKITLWAKNDNSVTTASKAVSIAGLDRVAPAKAGNKGMITLDLYGGDLTLAQTNVYLKKEGQANIAGENLHEVDNGHLQAQFLIDQAAIGKWDLVVDKGGVEQVLAEAFTVEEAKEAIPWVNIEGQPVVLLNRFQTYTIHFGNKGNTDAYSVPLWLMISEVEDMDVKFLDFSIDLPDYLQLHPDADLIKETAGEYFITDSIDGIPNKARVYPLLIPLIRANTTEALRIRLRTANRLTIKARITGAWIENTANGEPSPILAEHMARAATGNLSKAECLTSILGKGVIDQTLSLVPGYDCLSNGIGMARTAISFASGSSKQSFWSATWNIGLGAVNCGASLAKDIAFPLKFGLFMVNMASTAYDMKKCLEPEDDDDKDIRAITSFDPNEMIGPGGYGEENWIRPMEQVPYTILFENKETATAAAHEVFITDTLDLNKFDLSHFSFTSYGWGDTIFSQTATEVREFSREIDLRPAKNTVVRISGSLDEAKGVVNWNFVSLDPLTMDYHDDPYMGFLPPNGENHEGEGFVSFTVGLKEVTETGAFITNKASIVFDFNAPIITNEYINTFDLTPPESRVVSAHGASMDSILVVWSGSDSGAGVKSYTVWVQENNGELKPLFLNKTDNRGTFKATLGSNYKFYSVATDYARNEEVKIPSFELDYIFTKIAPIANNNHWIITPNPVSDRLFIKHSTAPYKGMYKIDITAINGSRLASYSYPAEQIVEGVSILVTNLPAGQYIVNIVYGNEQLARKIQVEK